FIVTLATFFVLQGVNSAVTLKLTGQTAIQNIDSASGFNSARKFLAGDLTHWDFKVKVLWWIGITLIGAWLLAKTRFGNWIYSAGGDPNSARNVGVPVARTKILLFVMTSCTASLLGILEADHISKYYGNIVALKDISTYVNAGEVTCILGDNGAGKSSFIKILSGVHQADDGRLLVEGEEVHFTSPRDARAKGIATVYQDLAMVPL